MSKEELIHNLKSMADTYNFVTNGKDKSETEQTVIEIIDIIEKS